MLEYRILTGNFGNELSLKQSWDDGFLEVIEENDVQGISLNTAQGWRHDNTLSFLRHLAGSRIVAISLFDYDLKDISGLYHLSQLRSLHLNLYQGSEVELRNFPHLEYLALEGNAQASCLSAGSSLRDLRLFCYKKDDTSEFGDLEKLIRLKINSGPVRSLEGLGKLKNLREMELYGLRRLASFKGLGGCERLEQIKLQACSKFSGLDPGGVLSNLQLLNFECCRKIADLNPISRFPNLRRLFFDDCGEINSLKPLRQLKHLERVALTGRTSIDDGNIEVLKGIPSLIYVGFTNKKHYNMKNNEFEDKTPREGHLTK